MKAALKGIGKQQPSVIIQSGGVSSSGGGMSMYLVLILGIAIVGGGWLYIRNKANTDAQNEAGKLQTDVYTRQASQFKNMIGEWYQFADKLGIIQLAKQISDWKKVVTAYALLNGGANLEADIRKILSTIEYNDFYSALNQKGIPTNKTGKITVTPKAAPNGLVVGKSNISLDNSKGTIPLYLSADTYGGKIDLTLPKNVVLPRYLLVGFGQANYVNTSTPWSIDLYKIQLSNGKQYFVSAAYVKKEPQFKALYGFEGFTIKAA